MKKYTLFFSALLSILIIRAAAQNYTITTVAGDGTASYSGDGGPATAAEINTPYGIFSDTIGNLYITDNLNQRMRKVGTNGIINTIVGDGTPGYSGDFSPATAAELNGPTGTAVDFHGNVFIGDGGNNRVRRIDIGAGTISTFAGNGTGAFLGDGGPATAAEVYTPTGIAVDAGDTAYFCDMLNQRIRKVTPSRKIYTVAGNGTSGFAGDGAAATAAELANPFGVALDSIDDIYIADQNNHRIRRVDVVTGNISTIAGNGTAGFSGDGGPATAAELNRPFSVAVDKLGNIYIADYANNRIRCITVGGTINTIAGNGTAGFTGDGGPATVAELNHPTGVSLDKMGNIYISDQSNNRIRKLSSGPTGINNVSVTHHLSIQSNPSDGTFAIKFNAVNEPGTRIEIYNLLGERIFTVSSAPNITANGEALYNVDLNHEPNGTYIVKIQKENGDMLTGKLEILK
jgi:hypothetical protein